MMKLLNILRNINAPYIIRHAVQLIEKIPCFMALATVFVINRELEQGIVAGGYGMYQLKKNSADGRTFIWKNTIELIKQNPFGVSIGNFSGSYRSEERR